MRFRSIAATMLLNVLAAGPVASQSETMEEYRLSEAKKLYQRVQSNQADPFDINRYAWDMARKGAYPEMRPSPDKAVQYLEHRLLTYAGPDRGLLVTTHNSLKKFAVEFFRDVAGAENDEMEALFQMGRRFHSEDQGVVKNRETALEYFSRAAVKGHVDANYNMAMLIGDDPSKRPQAIAYMQEAYRLGHRNAAGFLRDWNAPLSAQHAAAAAAAMAQSNSAASGFVAGSFSPQFWGAIPADTLQRRMYSRSELLPILEQIKTGGGGLPTSKGYTRWGMALGSAPSQVQMLRAANNVLGCILAPVTPKTVGGFDLQKTASVDYEEWVAGNRKAVRIGCATESSGIKLPGSSRVLYYLVDNKIVAIQVNFSIYDAAVEVGGTVRCSAPKYSPANIFANETNGSTSWTTIRQHNLSTTPLSGIRYGNWYTLTRPGAVMHIFPKRWPNQTIEGTSSVAKCGTGTVEYLVVTPQFNGALNITNARLPNLRIGRAGSIVEEDS